VIRPRPSRWFEALVARDDCTLLLEALAATGAVELEARAGATLPAAYAEIRPALQRFADFRTRYAPWWPKSDLVGSTVPEPPRVTLERGLAALDAWAKVAEPVIRECESNAAERTERQRWRKLLAALASTGLDAGTLARAGPLARAAVIEFPREGVEAATGPLLARAFEAGGTRYSVVVGIAADLDKAARDTAASHGRFHPVPAWITGDAPHDEAAIAARLAELDVRDAALARELDALARRHGLHRALADLYRLQWVLANVNALESGDRFAWVTGWSSDTTGKRLLTAVERSGARALLHFAAPPASLRAPLLLVNPRWARPFEIFPRALGVPGGTEVDPTVLLAIAVPLLFGYMFADVGQGLVIAVAGWWLRARTPVARLLVVGGLSAAAFGFVFGSVFSLHGAVTPLWIDPLTDPVMVLFVPIVAGAILLAIGLLLHALGSFWRGETARLLGEDLGLLAVYAAVLVSAFVPGAPWIAVVGALAFVAGHAIHAGRAHAALAGLGELLERTLQLLINTLSFARVGAFALAHAGLSAAVVALAANVDGIAAKTAIFVAGNVVIIAIEALVVSIQATRLVLFEFFARFLTGAGRPFRPLPPPSFVLE
jgi:V/A-type H+-transporting ATPase subunit I